MKKLISVFFLIVICISFSSCGQSTTEEENKILEALAEGDYSYEKYGDIISCSNIYSYNDENDVQYPFLMLDLSDKVNSYCYIDFSDDDEDVCVLVIEGDIKGSIITYLSSAKGSMSLLYTKDEDLVMNMFPDFASAITQGDEKVDEYLKKQWPILGYDLFYVPDDSTINAKVLSKLVKD